MTSRQNICTVVQYHINGVAKSARVCDKKLFDNCPQNYLTVGREKLYFIAVHKCYNINYFSVTLSRGEFLIRSYWVNLLRIVSSVLQKTILITVRKLLSSLSELQGYLKIKERFDTILSKNCIIRLVVQLIFHATDFPPIIFLFQNTNIHKLQMFFILTNIRIFFRS
jgi:hypothetical protein